MRIRFTEPAELDLERLADELADFDPLRAKGVTEQFKEVAEAVRRAPFLCSPLRVNPRFRKKSITPYLIIFEVKRTEIVVLRIVHERSDWISLI